MESLGFERSSVEQQVKKISYLSKKLNAEFYIVVYPWAVTLEHGQAIFNWEKFGKNLCEVSSCTKFISLFDAFNSEKKISKNWSTNLFFLYDTHWNEKGHKIVFQVLSEEIF